MYNQHIAVDFEMNPVLSEKEGRERTLHREIIEIGAVRLDSAGNIVDSFCAFVKPQLNPCVMPFITGLTGIRTSDVCGAQSFEEAVSALSMWIGSAKARIYSWSNADRDQLRAECEFKNVSFPENMRKWTNFQLVYPRIMGMDNCTRLMSLTDAAERYGLSLDRKRMHGALYDAEVTADLVGAFLTGEYRKQAGIYRQTPLRCTIGEASGGALQKYLQQMQQKNVEISR